MKAKCSRKYIKYFYYYNVHFLRRVEKYYLLILFYLTVVLDSKLTINDVRDSQCHTLEKLEHNQLNILVLTTSDIIPIY